MNRYKSSQGWRKVEAGWYVSPNDLYEADQLDNGKWRLYRWSRDEKNHRKVADFLTLADCQEHAEKLERNDASV